MSKRSNPTEQRSWDPDARRYPPEKSVDPSNPAAPNLREEKKPKPAKRS